MEKAGWPKPDSWLRRYEEMGSAELTPEEERIFEELGFDMSPWPEDEPDPLEESRRDFLELVTSSSFSVAEVAYNLNRPQAAISSWIDDRRLFAIWHEGRWRIPRFQFSEWRATADSWHRRSQRANSLRLASSRHRELVSYR